MFWKRAPKEPRPDPPRAEPPSGLDLVLLYHERTKHHPFRYARALGYMDWDTQPDPFRRYEGAPTAILDETPPEDTPSFDDMFDPARRTPATLDARFVSQLFYDSLAISAWKEYKEARWSLRVNPSSGNLHPTEGYLISGPVPGICDAPALHHYYPYLHALERRREIPVEVWDELRAGLPESAILVGLSSIPWRESWKYGERAFRYCQHDVGHAIGAVTLAASLLGWRAALLERWTDDAIAAVLGIDGQTGFEAEHPDCLIALAPHDAPPGWGHAPAGENIARVKALPLSGTPRPLSKDHHDWPIIEAMTGATAKAGAPPAELFAAGPPVPPWRIAPYGALASARRMIRQRRSAVDMDGKTSVPRATFYQMLARVLPGRAPFEALPWSPRIHLLLFVHRVDDLAPGTYMLVRDPGTQAELRASTPRLSWQSDESFEPGLLWLLEAGDVRASAQGSSCGQDIAADGAFAAAMIAHYEPSLRALGPWFYRRLHWEAGLIGQVLYLDAEAAGIRSTGIGCFFDDVVHQMLGLADRRFQDIYHFTVGGPRDDPRLRTLDAYAHRGV
ncbi:MAG: SagB/ThcOx family dehydrogenase [Acidobacteriota bacterium]